MALGSPLSPARHLPGAAGAAKPGPQSFLTLLTLVEVGAQTRTRQAMVLSTIPKRTRVYFGSYKPGSAQRIPPVAELTNPNTDRAAILARTRVLVQTLQQAAGQ